jgi:predicted nucleic acid-binding protein
LAYSITSRRLQNERLMGSSRHAEECRSQKHNIRSRKCDEESRADDPGATPKEDRGIVRRSVGVLERQAKHGRSRPPAARTPWQGMTFADASFLVSFFGHDEHTREAVRWWSKANVILTASRLVLFEAENSMRTLHLEGECTPAESRWAVEKMKRAIAEGLIEVRESRVKRLYPAAVRLSVHYSEQKRFGAMDILHVAAALDLCAKQFVSFDERQGELAKAEGLDVVP